MNVILLEAGEVDGAGRAELCDERARHVCEVLRGQAGQVIRVGVLDGPLGTGTIEALGAGRVTLRCELQAAPPPRPRVDVLLALPRPRVMRRLWAQLAAMGVGHIVVTNAARVERYYFDSHVLDEPFRRKHLVEGLQQAVDTRVPRVSIAKRLKVWLADELDAWRADATCLLADPRAEQDLAQTLPAGPGRVLVAVGPEGGWTDYERDLLAGHGFRAFRVGGRILRSDTACIALLAILSERLAS